MAIAELIEKQDYWSLRGRECEITIEQRPYYCDRGNYIAKIFPDMGSELELDIDHQDGWPRYYFDFDRMIAELRAWLDKRNQRLGAEL
jgi:hypothetical protein